MSTLLQKSLEVLNGSFDYTQNGMTQFQLSVTNEVLLAVADEEMGIDVKQIPSMTRDLGWSRHCTRMLMDHAELVNSSRHNPPALGAGTGFAIVRLNQIDLILKAMKDQDESVLSSIESLRQELDEKLKLTSEQTIQLEKSTHDDDKGLLTAFIIFALAILLISTFFQVFSHDDPPSLTLPSIGHG